MRILVNSFHLLVLKAVTLFFLIVLTGHTCSAVVLESFLEPNKQVDISPGSRDVIKKIHISEGEAVARGQLLVTLEHNILEARRRTAEILATTRGRLDSTQTLVEMRSTQLENLKKLKSSGHVRPKEIEKAEAELAIAQAEQLKAREEKNIRKAELFQIEAEIKEKKIVSPIKGIVVRIYRQEGELVGNGAGDVLVSIVQLQPLHAIFYVPFSQRKALKLGDNVHLSVDGVEKLIDATVGFISPIVTPESGTVRIRVDLPESVKMESGVKCRLTLAPMIN